MGIYTHLRGDRPALAPSCRDPTALAPTKLSVKRLPVESYRAILYRVLRLDIEGVE